jgi:hypothetical protein
MARWSSVFSLALVVLTTRFVAAQDKAPGPPPKPAEEKAAAARDDDKPPADHKPPADDRAAAKPPAEEKAAKPPAEEKAAKKPAGGARAAAEKSEAGPPPEEKAALARPPAEEKPAPAGLSRLSEELRSSTLTGKFKEIDVAARNAKISAPGVGSLVETPVRQPTRAALVRQAQMDRQVLGTEVRRWLPDLEACRTTVARSTGVSPAEVNAGTVGLRWTILPGGGSRGALVLEEDATDLEVMKCVRKRMNAWRFTAAVDGPVDVAYSYTFAALPRPKVPEDKPPAAETGASASEAKPAAPAAEGNEQSGAAKPDKKDQPPPAAEKKDEAPKDEAPPAAEKKDDRQPAPAAEDKPAPDEKPPEKKREEPAPQP